MKILALDSSSSVASVAMVDYSDAEKTVLYQHHEPHERTDSSSFFHGLEAAIQTAGKPDLIVVGLGPGSYNGLRVSMAAAQGMASALGVELRGIPSALAIGKEKTGYWIAGDARGGHYWLASVIDHQFLQEPLLLPPEDIPNLLLTHPDFPLLASTSLPKLPVSQNIMIKHPCAVTLALLSQEPSCKQSTLMPLYLKPAHITMPKQS